MTAGPVSGAGDSVEASGGQAWCDPSLLVNAAGVLVAVVGLLFLWVQIRQVKNQLILQNYSEYTRRYAEIVHRLPEVINSEEFELGAWRTDNDFMRNMRAFFDLCFEEWDLHNRELIPTASWNIWRGGIQTAMRRAAFQQAWEIVRDTSGFGDEFNNWMDSLAKS